MVSAAFKRLKQQSGVTEPNRLRHFLKFPAGTHKRKRLAQAVGTQRAKRTILDSTMHERHQQKLFTRFLKAWGRLSDAEKRRRLRLLTILDTVCGVEPKEILRAVEAMEEKLRGALAPHMGQLGIIGVAEVEIVDLGLYGEQDSDEEARKGQVLRDLVRRSGLKGAGTLFPTMTGTEHFALVHLHAIMDLGISAETTQQHVENTLRHHWQRPWCVELKRFFTTFSVKDSLRNLAGYLTKGGNDTLRFRKQFGGGAVEGMELAMVKQGYAESGEYEDHLGLSVGEVSVLVEVYDALMGRNSTRDGYVFLGGLPVRSRNQSRKLFRVWKSPFKPFSKSVLRSV